MLAFATQLWCQDKGKQKSGAIALSFSRYVELVKLLLGRGALRGSLSHRGSIANLNVLNVFHQSHCYTTTGAPRPASTSLQASQIATSERSLELNGQVQMLGCTPLARREMVPTRLLSPINREEIRDLYNPCADNRTQRNYRTYLKSLF